MMTTHGGLDARDTRPARAVHSDLTRRRLGILCAATSVMTAGAARGMAANEQSERGYAAEASAFIQQSGDKLVAILNGMADWVTKRRRVEQLIADVVDVRGIVRFALARYWHQISDTQRNELVRFFPSIMVGAVAN